MTAETTSIVDAILAMRDDLMARIETLTLEHPTGPSDVDYRAALDAVDGIVHNSAVAAQVMAVLLDAGWLPRRT